MTARLIIIGLLIAAGAGAVWFIYSKGFDAGYAQRDIEQQVVEDAQEAAETAASEELEVDREKIRTVYRTITKEVERVVEKPVYRDVCLDPDGLRVANAALAGALVPAGEPDRSMPDADSDRKRDEGSGPKEADRGR